jgi:Transposase and inactivated derivatives
VSDKIDAKLACDTLQIAINTRKPTEPILFHSDQGSQFKSQEFRKLLDDYHLMPSYSKPGYPYDNAWSYTIKVLSFLCLDRQIITHNFLSTFIV